MGYGIASASFLKKRSKKLLLTWVMGLSPPTPQAQVKKSFCAAFFKKAAACLSAVILSADCYKMLEADEAMSFFWTHREGAPHAECSQFYPRQIKIEAMIFNCCEQWMHWRKAVLFNDMPVAAAILAEPDPFQQKRLGRQVTNFSADLWNLVARDIVFRGNVAKFSQHPDLLERLRASCGTILVEASPHDHIWGIGLAADDPRARRKESWLGTNWLGEILTEVRVALCGG